MILRATVSYSFISLIKLALTAKTRTHISLDIMQIKYINAFSNSSI